MTHNPAKYNQLLETLSEEFDMVVIDAYKSHRHVPKNTKSYQQHLKQNITGKLTRLLKWGYWVTVITPSGLVIDCPAKEKYINLVKEL